MVERLRAAFYRGGTSKAVVFNGKDLPKNKALRNRIFLHVLGSPDPYRRQLDGMGGGLSSLSKVVIVEASSRPDADVDYTFVQIAVSEPIADYASTCGNMSSCVGPFAVEEGLVFVDKDEDTALVRIFNTNTGQIYHARFPVKDGSPVEQGDFAIPGVAGTGAAVSLDFLSPGGAATGTLLPTGNPRDVMYVPDLGEIAVSLIDAANPVVFFDAKILSRAATELPQDLDSDSELAGKIETIRRIGATVMGMASTPEETAGSNPKVAMISKPQTFQALDGTSYAPDMHDINVRLVSMGNFHRAITLTGGMCTAVAAQIPGTLIDEIVCADTSTLRIGTPSGVLPAQAVVELSPDGPVAVSAGTLRTQRRIMEGAVLYPSSFLEETA